MEPMQGSVRDGQQAKVGYFVLAGLSLLCGLGFGTMGFVAFLRLGVDSWIFGLLGVFSAIAGLAGAAVVLMIRRVSLERPAPAVPAPTTLRREDDDKEIIRRLDEMQSTLASLFDRLSELEDAILLPEADRQTRRDQRYARRVEELTAEMQSALDAEDFSAADAAIDALARLTPAPPELDSLRADIEARRQRAQAEAVQAGLRHTTELMSAERFAEAQELALRLQAEHPDVPEVNSLLGRVQREANTFEDEQRRRLFQVVQEHGQARQWASALQAAHRLLERYTASAEAEQVRAMMPMLVDNARIQNVRARRDQFVDLMDRHRYGEAVEIARDIVENYPETQAAEELRVQLPRLIQLAGPPREA